MLIAKLRKPRTQGINRMKINPTLTFPLDFGNLRICLKLAFAGFADITVQ